MSGHSLEFDASHMQNETYMLIFGCVVGQLVVTNLVVAKIVRHFAPCPNLNRKKSFV